tara:strand:- start:85 stop:216 length:132 start_codon:yes stop_codon:yes gene_type:complete
MLLKSIDFILSPLTSLMNYPNLQTSIKMDVGLFIRKKELERWV